jgi:hypothetical protein
MSFASKVAKIAEPPIQTRLRVGHPDDAYEHEADRIADQVMRTPEGTSARPRPTPLGQAIQRKCSACEDEERGTIQREGGHDVSLPTGTPAAIDSLRSSGGSPLPASVRSFFEPRFGHDFSAVRVHTDQRAGQTARGLQARAFTIGRDVVFGAGEYQPDTSAGRRLLAHELVHVMQQGSDSSVIRRACLSAAQCAAPLNGCTSGTGSARDFQAQEQASEGRSRTRRRRMGTGRQRSTGHVGHARQLEEFLRVEAPSVLAGLHGIFIDMDLSPGSWGYVVEPPCEVDSAADPRQQVAGAAGPCVFIHGALNQQALQFNTTSAPRIGGMSREDWRIDTIAGFTHELQHTLFSPATVPAPIGVGCARTPQVESELSELNAILVEFKVVRDAAARNPSAAERARIMRAFFDRVVPNCGESIAGTLKKLRCLCDCPDVDAWVRATFTFVTGGWTATERAEFNTEMHDARWNPWDLRWPIP